jgi:Fe/S biogenesis protein NfuA
MLLIMSVDTPTTDNADVAEKSEVVLAVTDAAMDSVLAIRAEEPEPTTLGLRVEITGSTGTEYTYDLSFEELAGVGDDHVRYTVGELTVVIPADSVENLRGAELDLPRSAGQGGLVIRNPNRPNPLAGVELELTGDIADKVTQLLEGSVNPALAAHGGYTTLVGVDDDNNVYVTMGGGCQGCSASAATLTDGIRRSILDAIPEVTEVIDATDHSAGENPFYT